MAAASSPDSAGAPSKGAPARPPLPGGRFAANGSIVGQLVKIALLSLFTALGVWAVLPLYVAGNWWGIGLVAAVVGLVYYVYLSKRAVPAKYLVPGVVFLLAFQILPVLYTMSTSVTNLSDGHRGDKDQAIAAIEAFSVTRDPDSPEYVLTVATTGDPETGELVFLLTDAEGNAYAGTDEGLSELGRAEVDPAGKVTDAFGYTLLSPAEVNARSEELQQFAVPTRDGAGIRSSGLSSAFEGSAIRVYDEECDCMTDNETGVVYTADNDRGAFYNEDGQRLAQGWQVNVGLDNFARFLLNPTFASSFFGILLWNITFAVAVTGLVFVVGLAIAMTLHVPRMRGKTFYRILVILPYAMSSLAMYLLWRDMFNTDFGLFNRMLGLQVDWLGDVWTARAAVILTNVWLGYPYMFLVATGALQASATVSGKPRHLAVSADGQTLYVTNFVTPRLPGEDTQLLLVIDQFEELFSMVGDPHLSRLFLDSLTAVASDPRGHVRVVITLRADFFDRPLEFHGFGSLMEAGLVPVTMPSEDGLALAVSRPARLVGLELEPGLIAEIVRDVEGQPGGLPLMQHALTELAHRRRGRLLTFEAYAHSGGVTGALGNRAEEVFVSLNDAEQRAAEQVFLRLITVDETTEDAGPPAAGGSLRIRVGAVGEQTALSGIMRMVEAAQASVTRHWWQCFGLFLLAWLVGSLGLLACGVGIFLTLPVAVGAVVCAYETIFGSPAAREDSHGS